jgi:hypothetical protein
VIFRNGEGALQILSSLVDILPEAKLNLVIYYLRLNYTRNEWRRCKTTPETSGEDGKLHSKRVEKIQNYTRNEWRRFKTTLESSAEVYARFSDMKVLRKRSIC